MLNFKSYLTESLDVTKLKHLEHAEDHIIHGGHEGVMHAHDTLADVSDFLAGKKSKTRITQKFDGAPSIVFGINPDNGQFFVSTKSAFNKSPKLAYNDKDIEEMFGHAPGLEKKLKIAFEEIKKIMPKEGGVFQGDVMYSKDDIVDEEGKLKFTPNTITYGAKADSAAGRRVAASKFGIVVHTRYLGKTMDDMTASFDVDQSKFKKDPDVNMISPEVSGESKMPAISKSQYEKSMKAASELMAGIHQDTLDKVSLQEILIKTHINQHVRSGTAITVKSYLKYLEEKMKKDVESLKTEAAKEKKRAYYQERIDAVESDKDEFEKVFKLHATVQKAKDALVQGLAQVPGEFETTIGGEPVKPEGFVAIRNGRPTKLVDRAEFSAANFAQGAFQKKSAEGDQNTVGEPPIPPDEEAKNPAVFSYGRMNPPTAGHGVLVSKVQELAKERKAKHRIVLSRSQDAELNPLSPEEKGTHAKRMFSDANIEVADESNPTIIHQMKRLEKEGHDVVTVVVGSDRVEAMKKLLDSYNGKEYKFKRIEVVSAGQRDPDAEDDDPKSVSATRQRKHAINNKFGEFRKGLPKTFHPEHARELFNATRTGMDIKIDQNTSGISLARYAKRDDVIGTKARKEIERRLKLKEIEKKSKVAAKAPKGKKLVTKPLRKAPVAKPKAPAKPKVASVGAVKPVKKIKSFKERLGEDTSTANIRGLGNVTGNPAGDLANYVAAVIADSDQRQNQLWSTVKSMHTNLHTAAVDKNGIKLILNKKG